MKSTDNNIRPAWIVWVKGVIFCSTAVVNTLHLAFSQDPKNINWPSTILACYVAFSNSLVSFLSRSFSDYMGDKRVKNSNDSSSPEDTDNLVDNTNQSNSLTELNTLRVPGGVQKTQEVNG